MTLESTPVESGPVESPDISRVARPDGVSILAFLAALGTVIGFVALLVSAPALDQGTTLFGLASVGLSALVAYGLWNLRPWAWILALIVSGLSTIYAIYLLTGGQLNSNLIVGPLVLVYLYQPGIRRVFGR
jgi:uncharacterized membrane protein (DUF2068 family)